MLNRKKGPKCHTCGGPMKGHTRPRGNLVCPSPPSKDKPAHSNLEEDFSDDENASESPPSCSPSAQPNQLPSTRLTPPTSPVRRGGRAARPQRNSTPGPSAPPRRTFVPIREPPSFDHGPWRRQNPNFVEKRPPAPLAPSSDSGQTLASSTPSLIPTEIVGSDGRTLHPLSQGFPSNEAFGKGYQGTLGFGDVSDVLWASIAHKLPNSSRIATIIDCSKDDTPHIKAGAFQANVHVDFIHAPQSPSKKSRGLVRRNSWWAVIGGQKDHVETIKQGQEDGLEAALAIKGMRRSDNNNALCLVLAGAVGGVVAFGGFLAFL